MCRVDGLHHRYDGFPAVQGLSLTLRGGQVVALMGRNGSGKTTLLKLVAGLLRPQRGTVSLDGIAAYVPQDADSLLFAPTVDEELRGQSAEVVAPFAAWLQRYPRDLSSGEVTPLFNAFLNRSAPDQPWPCSLPDGVRTTTSPVMWRPTNASRGSPN